MSTAVFRAMLLGLLRDRAALAMSFILPGLVFLIFAAIFSGATGEQLRLEVAVADGIRSSTSVRLIEALGREPSLRLIGDRDLTAERVRELVRRGTADVGLIFREGTSLESLGGFGPAPLILVSDPARGAAVPMLAGQVQRAYFSALPDVALGGVIELLEDEFLELDDDQQRDVELGLADLREEAMEAVEQGRVSGWGFQELFEREDVAGRSARHNHVAYYAGAIAVLFLLFSAVHGAITLLEESESGLIDRILAGPGHMGVLINGKFLFLVAQGFMQIAVIFVLAWAIHGIDLPGHLLPWALTTLTASAAAAGMALVVATACRTRRQAQTLSNVAILILSALGGSMVPRFLMPDLLQQIGWITPNTWAIEAYTAIFWRDQAVGTLIVPWIVLAASAILGLVVARRLARRMEVL
jgi:ABC-2 type transport system permease protein